MIGKIIVRTLASLFSILCMMIVVVIWAAGTEVGTQQIFKLARGLMGDHLNYQEVKGSLLSHLELVDLHYQDEGISVRVAHIYLNWRPIDLLQKKLVMNVLTGDNIQIDQYASEQKESTASQPFSLKNWRLEIKKLAFNQVSYRQDKKEKWRLQELSGAVELDSQLSVHLAAINVLPLPMTAQLTLFGNEEKYAWGLALKDNSKTKTDLMLSGLGNRQGTTFKIENPRNHFLDGTVSGEGKIIWSPQLQWQISLQTQKVNLSMVDLNSLGFQLVTIGNLQDLNLQITDIEGEYQHTPLAGYAYLKAKLPAIPGDSTEATIKTLLTQSQLQVNSDLRLGLWQATFLGELNRRWQMQFKVQVPELNKIMTTAKGHLNVSGRIVGDPLAPDIATDIDLQNIVFTQLPAATFKGKLKLHTALLPKRGCDYLSLYSPKSSCHFQLQAELRQSELSLKNDSQILHFPLAGDLHSDFSRSGLASNIVLQLYAKPFLSAQLKLPGYQLGQKLADNQVISGHMVLSLNQSQLGNYSVPIIKNWQAKLTANLKVAGHIHQPDISGEATLLSPAMDIPEYNLHLTQTKIGLLAKGDKLDYIGTSYSGGGHIQMQGQSLLSGKKLISSFTLTGQNFLTSNTNQIKFYTSPNLKIQNQEDAWHITGVIDVPKATIAITDTSNIITLPSETIIITNKQRKADQSNPLAIFIHVLIRLGQDIQVKGRGFSGKLAGAVTILESPGHPRLADGEIKVTKGVYAIRGDQLTIDHGYARFANSLLENPSLDIQASKLVKFQDANQTTFDSSEVRVGARVSGTADQPIIKLFSDPASWSQTDILSFLILGQPASVSSGPNLQLLMRTAQLLKSGSSNNLNISSLQKKLQNSLGLSELDFVSGVNTVDGSQQSSNSLLIGKKLTPRLSISYSVSILNAVNTLRLKYLLNKHWLLQSDSSIQGNGADIIYSIKK